MGEQAKKKRAAEARAARKAKKAVDQVEAHPSSTDPTDPTQSNPKKPKKQAAVLSSASQATRLSTRSSSKLASGTSSKVEATTALSRPVRTATAAANSLLQQLHIAETTDSDLEDSREPSDHVEMELDDSEDEDDDEGSCDDEGSGDGSDIEIVVDKGKKPVVRKAPPGPKTSRGAQRKANLQVIDEDSEGSDSEEEGESFTDFLCWVLKNINSLRNDFRA